MDGRSQELMTNTKLTKDVSWMRNYQSTAEGWLEVYTLTGRVACSHHTVIPTRC